MLYNEEVDFPKKYDPDTGEDTYLSVQEREEMEAGPLIQRAESLESLKKHQGYKILEDYLNTCISAYKDKLVQLDDIDRIRRMQVAVRCYDGLLKYIEHEIFLGKDAKQRQRDNPLKDPKTGG